MQNYNGAWLLSYIVAQFHTEWLSFPDMKLSFFLGYYHLVSHNATAKLIWQWSGRAGKDEWQANEPIAMRNCCTGPTHGTEAPSSDWRAPGSTHPLGAPEDDQGLLGRTGSGSAASRHRLRQQWKEQQFTHTYIWTPLKHAQPYAGVGCTPVLSLKCFNQLISNNAHFNSVKPFYPHASGLLLHISNTLLVSKLQHTVQLMNVQ